jgi:hypothetical protein
LDGEYDSELDTDVDRRMKDEVDALDGIDKDSDAHKERYGNDEEEDDEEEEDEKNDDA